MTYSKKVYIISVPEIICHGHKFLIGRLNVFQFLILTGTVSEDLVRIVFKIQINFIECLLLKCHHKHLNKHNFRTVVKNIY